MNLLGGEITFNYSDDFFSTLCLKIQCSKSMQKINENKILLNIGGEAQQASSFE